MSPAVDPQVGHLPEDIMFSIARSPPQQNAARLGLLKLPNRNTIQTPHYIGVASRGVLPHLSPDNYAKETDIRGVYTALEDCKWSLPLTHRKQLRADKGAYKRTQVIEKQAPQVPPIYKFNPPDGSSPLRRFTGLADDSLLVLGARRTPPIPCPTSSTPTSLSVLTSVGYRQLTTAEFFWASAKLKPDIIIGAGDIAHGAEKVSKKKIDKTTDRTTKWMLEHTKARREDRKSNASETQPLLYAPILPLPTEAQSWYTDRLVDDMQADVDGLAVYDAGTIEGLPPALHTLPRMGLTEPKNPNALLREIALGMDLFTVPFIGDVTDAGIALDFSFPVKQDLKANASEPEPLGIDMWQSAHAVDLSPLSPGCSCYACNNHHRAYMQHLLAAKEMLGWVLLQIHNHHTMDHFFAGVRESIANGTFEKDTTAFQYTYESELPAKTGQGPRVRGYQYRAAGPGQPKANPPAFKNLNDAKERLAPGATPSPSADAKELEAHGFATRTT